MTCPERVRHSIRKKLDFQVQSCPDYIPSVAAATPSTAKGRATRQRVIAAAAALVRERGAAATSIEEVCRSACVSRGQLYHYFEDRDDLLRAVVAHTEKLVLGAQADHLERLGCWEAIDGWLEHLLVLQAASARPAGCPLGSLVSQLADRDEPMRDALAGGFDRWERHLREGLERLRATGELRPDADPAMLATATMAALQGGLLLAHVRSDTEQLRRALAGARMMLGAARA
jgi:TetR/AcrR family transcriptional regulator, transcriptional repressor for nem operon